MIKRVLTILSILCVLCNYAKAQSSTTETEVVDINLVNVIVLTFNSTGTSTGSAVSLSFTTINDFTTGKESTVQQLTAASTKPFNITVKTQCC